MTITDAMDQERAKFASLLDIEYSGTGPLEVPENVLREITFDRDPEMRDFMGWLMFLKNFRDENGADAECDLGDVRLAWATSSLDKRAQILSAHE